MAQVSRPFSLDEYELIVENVLENWQSHPTLRALCLTQRSLVPLCQKRIFSSITCTSEKVDTLPDIVRTSPHLFDYIRDFYYELDDSDQPPPVKSRRNENTVQFFERIHDLHSLSVSTLEESYEVRWEVIDPQVRNALLRLILSPSLRSLELYKIRNFPPEGLLGLRHSHHLKTISFTSVALNLVDVANAAQAMNITASESAVMTLAGGPSDKSPVSMSYPPIFDFASLRNIYAEFDSPKDTVANRLLIGIATQLEDLFFVLPKNSAATFAGLAAAILNGPVETLRDLKLYAMEPCEDDDDPFLGIVPELTQLAGGRMKCLESIDMHLHIYTSDSADGPLILCPAIDTGCKTLDGLFADRAAFPALRSISIYFLVSILDEYGYGNGGLERQFHAVSRRISQQSFKNLDAIPSIANSFRLEMEWTDE
ncbi:hypothetical protein BJ912DRAFT_288146 [Pholiota molesta]|nr:hypothetical protein BJ912DRAFT_288146 [Pholiota molesta]